MFAFYTTSPYKIFKALLLFAFLLALNPATYSQEKKPEIAEFGTEIFSPPAQVAEIKPLIIDDETSYDSAFIVTFEQLTKYYQSARLIIALQNRSEDYVDHIWFQLRLLDKKSGFLYREQAVLFTGIAAGQKVRLEVICESISPEEIGFVVLRPELIEIDDQEYPFNQDFFKLNNASSFDLQFVFNTRFQ
ncbi:MAG: hypothetical protein PF694_12315 [Bacteroidetes bacterium]|nr:hypothetical protein [Bacteroidota bacterium]